MLPYHTLPLQSLSFLQCTDAFALLLESCSGRHQQSSLAVIRKQATVEVLRWVQESASVRILARLVTFEVSRISPSTAPLLSATTCQWHSHRLHVVLYFHRFADRHPKHCTPNPVRVPHKIEVCRLCNAGLVFCCALSWLVNMLCACPSVACNQHFDITTP